MKRKTLLITLMLCFAFLGVAKAQQSLPYSYGFENNDLAADGWIANVTNASSGINSAAAHSGSYGFRFQYSEQSGSLISPVLTGGDKGVDVSFWYKEYSNSYGDEQFYVGYTTDANTTDADRFTYGTIVSASLSWQQYTYSFPAGTKRIAIKYVYNDAFYLYLDDFTFEAASDCPRPKNLAVDCQGTTATISWTEMGSATEWNLDIDGTVVTTKNNPYTLSGLDLNTTYTVKVQADCGSDWSDEVSFTTDACLAEDMCSITLALTDSYNDGWNGGKMEVVDAKTSKVYGTYTIETGGSATYELALCPGTVVNFVYTAGSYGTENGWVIYDASGEVITEEAGCNSGCTHTDGIQATYTMNCSGCFKPSNLQATNIGTETADLSWTGNSDSYLLQYRPWIAAGDDVLPTATMTPYTFDLSQYSGTGSVVIRHYDVTNMFRLIVDDIEVTNAGGTVVYSQDFEDCGGVMPSEFSLMDMDGDGYNWEVVTNSQSYVNGTYGLSSASWNSTAGPLTPDNWIILSGIELGGSITFSARGQDANFPAENFCVYVCPDNALVEIPVNGTTYAATGLIPHSVYAWQVKGVCGDEGSSYASSMFSTLDDLLVFATEGEWNVLSNWTDAQGNAATALPTINDKVQIDANVTIPNGVVAYAKKATLNGGGITIADGGQLKMDATAVVTIEKVIEGYGENDGYYYFIASPLTTTRLTYVEDWSYVNALTGNYDLYTFDATQELEWINYKNNSTHANFTSGENNPVFVSENGYLYANKTTTTLQFEGSTAVKSYNNVETKEFTYNAASTDNWNGWDLVGNPYTCNAYISYVDANDEALDADFYTLNNDNTYTLMSSKQPLPPCTGAFINYSVTGKVQFSTEAPAKHSSMLNMTVSQNRKTVDQARVRFGQGTGLAKISFREGNTKIYIPQDNKDYAVVYAENTGEMPVNFKAESNGNYTINFSNEEVEFSYLHLIDNLTGADVDLLANPSYSFEAKTTDYTSRFKLVFATGNSVNGNDFGFISNNHLKIFGIEGNATVKVMDITGRTLSTENFNGSYDKQLNLSAGVYMIQLIQGNDVKTQKIVIR